ncbi:unnamed protein product [Brassica napus]|uniref:(rape) hypothetical protein n=1 Tax=Brassica napus TaxID=3708 RepID=A0A817AJB2_BRANA|nr:unnamed protein product [Brassica napus]
MLDCCYSRLGLSHVASGLGELMQTHKSCLETTTLGEAKDETAKEHAQFTVASDQEEMVQVERSGTETQDGDELKDHSTPPSCFKHSPISTSQKDSYTIFSHSSPDAMTFQKTESNQEVVVDQAYAKVPRNVMDDSAWKRETRPKGSRFLNQLHNSLLRTLNLVMYNNRTNKRFRIRIWPYRRPYRME